jgi:hypothetical protein
MPAEEVSEDVGPQNSLSGDDACVLGYRLTVYGGGRGDYHLESPFAARAVVFRS